YQLFMVLKGSGTRFIGDSVRPYKEGDISLTGPDLPHLWRSDQEASPQGEQSWSEGVVVYFHQDILGENFMKKEEALKLQLLFKKSIRGLDIRGAAAVTTRKMMLRLLKSRGFDSVLELLGLLNFLSKADDLEILASPGYTNTLKEGDTQRMSTVYAYVMKHFKHKMAVSELAALTNMTETSFSRYFKVHANKTFSEFVSEIRIGHACKLLIEKKLNVSQTCYASGFQTLSNFNRQFRAITGKTPLSYKREFSMT
ncbi:MAG: AraC family transcriptional regulator, partial [Chitinophagaceae bacterium]